MKRSEINELVRSASACFESRGWILPPEPRWDVTDFGLGEWQRFGLVLINLAEEPEYCEKLMYAQRGMTTPAHYHRKKKEDIICRWGTLAVQVWSEAEKPDASGEVVVPVNGQPKTFRSGDVIVLQAGSRVTLNQGAWHEFKPASDECIIGEVSTANDDLHDNIFDNADVGRFPNLVEDAPPVARLISDK